MISLIRVFFQDSKERQVHWFLFPIIGLLCGVLFYQNTLPELFLTSVTINFIFVALLIFVVYLYSKIKLKNALLKSIGLGDILFFLAVSLSFSTVSFIIIFISSLIFSLGLHLFISKNQKTVTIPLAGYMSLFFFVSYIFHWTGFINVVYNI